jgi:multidrug efflux system membrane fusion protein
MKYSIMIIGALALLLSCSKENKTGNFAPPPIPVVATEVVLRDVPLYIDSIGSIKPAQMVEIRPQVSGMLMQVHFKEGDRVKKGDRLFSIDTGSYKIRLKETEAQLANDTAQYEASLKKYERYEKLSQKDLIPRQEWEEIQASLERAKASLKVDEAHVEDARRDVDHATIRAPISGTIGRASVDPGNLISEGQPSPLAILSDLDTLYVDFALTEKEFLQLNRREGMQIEICPLCGIDKRGSGVITYVDHQFDPKNGMVTIRAQINNEGQIFLPGQGVKVLIPVNTIAGAKLLPQKAVKINQSGPYVYVIQSDQTVAIRQVVLGDEAGEDVIITEGVEPEEKVVLEGHLRLAPGMKVEIKGSAEVQ